MSDLAIITGASSGLGLAIARATPFPARIIDISRSGPPEGVGVEHWGADLSEPAEWQRIASLLEKTIDEEEPERSVFVHAAGTLRPIGFAGEVDSQAYFENVILNSGAGQALGHAYLAALRGRPGLHDLVMISSGAASSAYAGWSSYGAGKAALNQWVRNVGEEQKLRGGVRVCAVGPGVIDTAMQTQIRQVSSEDFPRVQKFHELHDRGSLVEPEDAARRFWEAIEAGQKPGSVIDLRSS